MHRPKPDKCPESGTRTNTDYVPYGPEWESYCMRLTKDRIIKMWREVCIERDRLQKLRSPGNLAAMREALQRILLDLYSAGGPKMSYAIACGVCKAIARHALATPPRNCDVGAAEEQYRRFMAMCNSKDGRQCSTCEFRRNCYTGRDECFARWAQMPYEATKGGAE